MHNGVVTNFLDIGRDMCDMMDDDAYANISGSTDSEHFAALYMTFLTNGKGKKSWEQEYSVSEMRDAIKKAIEAVVQLQRSKLDDKAVPNSLNVAATDGTQIVAFRFRNHKSDQPPSLYYSTSAGVTLNRKYPDHPDGKEKEDPQAPKKAEQHGSHVIIASEPSTYKAKQWTLIEKNHCIMVEKNGSVKLEEVKYPQEWNTSADDN